MAFFTLINRQQFKILYYQAVKYKFNSTGEDTMVMDVRNRTRKQGLSIIQNIVIHKNVNENIVILSHKSVANTYQQQQQKTGTTTTY